MSSLSSGVMKVRSRRFTPSWVTWSASCSNRFSASMCASRRSGGASNSARRCFAASLLRLATSMNRSKNSSSRGSRRTEPSAGGVGGKDSGAPRRRLGYRPMATTQQPQVDFVKAISRLDATALVVGSMIGSGIFIVSAEILREVHAPGLLLVVWAASGVVTLMGALSYGELAAMFPKAGGQYVYLREGISPLFGYLYGWTLFLVIQTGTIAAVAVAFARFTAVFWPGLSPDVFLGSTVHFPQPIGDVTVGLSPQRLLAVLSVALLTWINVRGVRTAALIQTSLTAVKTAALAALIVLGLTIGRHADAIAANFGGNTALIWWGGGVSSAMARDDLFFKSAGVLPPRYKTPAVALVVQAVWTGLLCLSGTYTQLLNFVIFAALVFYMLTAVGLFALRVTRPQAPRPVRTPGYPWLPALYVIFTGVIAVDLLTQDATRTYSFLGLGLVLIGVPVYFAWRAMVRRAA